MYTSFSALFTWVLLFSVVEQSSLQKNYDDIFNYFPGFCQGEVCR